MKPVPQVKEPTKKRLPFLTVEYEGRKAAVRCTANYQVSVVQDKASTQPNLYITSYRLQSSQLEELSRR